MTQKLLLVLVLILSVASTLAEELVFPYPDPESQSISELDRATSLVITELFQDSHFTLVPRSLPFTYRRVSEVADNRLDIIAININENVNLAPKFIVTYPEPIFSLQVGYYSLRDSGLTEKHIAQLGDNRLGIINMPKPVLDVYFDHPIESFETYNSYIAMSKGLMTKRIDILVGNPLNLKSAFKQLGIEKKVVRLKQAFIIDIHLGVRANLPLDTREAIFTLMDQRLPEFKRLDKLRLLFEKHNLDYSSVLSTR